MSKLTSPKFNIFLLVAMAVVLIAHYSGFLPLPFDQLILAGLAIFATLPVVVRAIKSIKNKKPTIDLLAAMALFLSLLAKEWPSAVFINLMLTSARIFANYTDERARRAIASLLKLKPKTAKVERYGKIFEIPLEEVKVGDLVVVELGETIPVDGIIEKGEASIDQSSLTGESEPVSRQKGDRILSSTIVVSGNLVIKTEKIGKETTFERIINLVENSQKNKAKINSFADKFVLGILFFTIVLSATTYAVTQNIHLVLALLLVTCADDIAVAIPMAFSAAIGIAAKRGVIIKGSNYLEGVNQIKTIVVDKTGTLTRGRLKVHKFFPVDQQDEAKILSLAGTACAFSNHPSAKAIIKYLDERDVFFSEPDSYDEYSGKGAVAILKGKKITTGKLTFFDELGIKITPQQLEQINQEKEKGVNVTLVGYESELIGFFALADEIKPDVAKTVLQLKKMGIKRIVMLTGDNEENAKRVANAAGISEFAANLLPQDKIDYIKKLLNKNQKTAMIGDGVNDAASLALADVGIAMGSIGADASIETADIVLMKDDFSKVPQIIELSRATLKIARQDFWLWGAINAIGLAAVFIGILTPTSAAAFNFVTDFIPLFNSMKLFRLHLKKQ